MLITLLKICTGLPKTPFDAVKFNWLTTSVLDLIISKPKTFHDGNEILFYRYLNFHSNFSMFHLLKGYFFKQTAKEAILWQKKINAFLDLTPGLRELLVRDQKNSKVTKISLYSTMQSWLELFSLFAVFVSPCFWKVMQLVWWKEQLLCRMR